MQNPHQTCQLPPFLLVRLAGLNKVSTIYHIASIRLTGLWGNAPSTAC